MSNDTNYSIQLSGHPAKIREVLEFLEAKKSRWEAFQKENYSKSRQEYDDALEKAMRDAGVKDSRNFGTWGFNQVGRIRFYGENATVTLHAFANENWNNRHISGDEGELADIASRFPELEFRVDYKDEHSSGKCIGPSFEKLDNYDEEDEEEEAYEDEEDEEEEDDCLDSPVNFPRSENPELNLDDLYSLLDVEDLLLEDLEKKLGRPNVDGVYYSDANGIRRYASIEFRPVDQEVQKDLQNVPVSSLRSNNPDLLSGELKNLRDVEQQLLKDLEKRLGKSSTEGIYYTDSDGNSRCTKIEFRLVDHEARHESQDCDDKTN